MPTTRSKPRKRLEVIQQNAARKTRQSPATTLVVKRDVVCRG
jgi:hypothetical protein